jgi:hypothetical protein
MCNPAECAIQAELNSFSVNGYCPAPAKSRKTPAFYAHSADQLNQFSFIGHGFSLTPLWKLDGLELSAPDGLRPPRFVGDGALRHYFAERCTAWQSATARHPADVVPVTRSAGNAVVTIG